MRCIKECVYKHVCEYLQFVFVTEQVAMSILRTEAFLWATKIEFIILKFFQVITASPINIKLRYSILCATFEKPLLCWSWIIVILILLYASIVCLLQLFCIIPISFRFLGFWNVLFDFFSTILTCIVIFIETRYTYQLFIRFLYTKRVIECQLQKLCGRDLFDIEKYRCIQRYFRILSGFLIFVLMLAIFNIIRTFGDQWLFYWLCQMIPLTYTRLRCLQHCFFTCTIHFYVKLVRIQVDRYIQEIEHKATMAREQQMKYFILNSKSVFSDLCLIERIFNSIHQMTFLTNRMFRLSLLWNVIENFIQLLSNMIWIYSKLHNEDLRHLSGKNLLLIILLHDKRYSFILDVFLRILPTVVMIIILLSSCEQCTKEVRV